MKQTAIQNNEPFMIKSKKTCMASVRQSQPLPEYEHLIDDVARIKKNYQITKHKISQMKKSQQLMSSPPNKFSSPRNVPFVKVLNQIPNSQSPKHEYFPKKQNQFINRSVIQGILKKADNKSSKQLGLKNKEHTVMNSLQEIQKLLSQHKKGQSHWKTDRIRSPRYSQTPATQDFFMIKSNKSKFEGTILESKRQNYEQQNSIDELKQTISTQSSCKYSKNIKIDDFYIGKDLGKGKFGKVKMVKHKKTGLIFSLKVIQKSLIEQEKFVDQLIKEIKIQSFNAHSHIIKLYSVFDDPQNVYLLLQFCHGGNLYEYMKNKGKISQKQGSILLKSICSAIQELHQNHIIHRDLKPQNIVLCYGMPKICDFGWSTCIKNSMRQTLCGTPLYISPQILKGELYDEKVDQWALGTLGYQLLTGNIPFQIHCQKDLSKIIEQKIEYPSYLSSKAVDFLNNLLQKNPKNRLALSKILLHPFLNNN